MYNRFRRVLRLPWIPYLCIFLATYAVYFKTVTYRFTNFDDTTLIVDNFPFISDPGNIVQAFRQKVFAGTDDMFYRPLLTLSLMLDARLGGTAPFIYHLTNILIHLGASWLLFAFLRTLGYGRRTALIFALLFNVHPLTAPAVAWVPGRNDTLLALFVLASFIGLVRYVAARRPASCLGHLACLALALFTKEIAVMAVPLGVLYVYLFSQDRTARTAVLRVLVPGWILVMGLWLAARASVPGALGQASGPDFLRSLAYGLPAFVPYLGKLVFPWHLSVLPVIADMPAASGILALTLLLAVLVLLRRRHPAFIVFGLSWFVLFLLPSLASPDRYYLEHRMYLPMIGMIFVFAEARAFAVAPAVRRVAYGAVPALVLLLSVLTFTYSDRFVSSLVFWMSAVRSSPHSPIAHNGLGKEYLGLNLLDPAEKEFARSLELDPRNIDALMNRGIIDARKKKFDEADAKFRETLRRMPGYFAAYINYGQLCMDRGRVPEALAMWRKAVDLNPGCRGSCDRLIAYYRGIGDEASAARYAARQKRGK